MTSSAMQRKSITPRHFRGISTEEDLQARCLMDDFTGCWHWQGAMREDRNGTKTPAIWVFDTQQKKFRTMTGPMAVLEIVGRRAAGVKMAWRTCRCEDCLNPAHIAGGTRADWGLWMRANGFWKNVPARVAANRKSARARSENTPERIAEVRSSPLNGREASAAFGMSTQLVSKIRNRKCWADNVVPGASVFTLGAR